MNRSNRAMVLLGVMLVVAMAALAGTTAMYMAQAELASSRTALKRVQSRAMAWSGVQGAMAEMADQREKLLDGAAPELTQQWEVFAEEGGPRGVVRLQAWTEGGPTAQSESAKLDLNTATAEMLGKVGLDERVAAAVAAARDKSKFASVGDLTRIEGFDPILLRRSEDGQRGSGAPAPAGAAAGSIDEGLADLVTVFSFDPNIQSGLGDNGSDHRGALRVNLHTPWSDRLASAVDERFGQGASATLKAMFDKGVQFKSLGDVAAAAQAAGLPVAGWGPIFDALTVTEDPYLIGRVDLNRAPATVIASIPGISQEQAEQIVQMRDKLDDETKRTVCWPLIQGVLKPDEFGKAADHLTTRSMQWRIRVEAGLAYGAEAERADRAPEPLTDRMVLEAVIDVASERPRVAYLRDVTLERAMESVYAAAASGRRDGAEDAPAPSAEPAPTGPSGEVSDGMKLGTDLNLNTDLDLSFGAKAQSAGTNPAGAGPASPIQNDGAPTGAGGAPAPGVDRRVGRWTVGGEAGAGE